MGRESTTAGPPDEFRYRWFLALFVSIGILLGSVTDLPLWAVTLITALATTLIERSSLRWYGRRTAQRHGGL